MPRTPAHESTTSINFRMPDSLLKKIDDLAHKNYHDRTTEINNACKHWADIEGEISPVTLSNSAIAEIEKRLDKISDTVTTQISDTSKEILEIKKDLAKLIFEHENERKHLLKIIEEGMKRK